LDIFVHGCFWHGHENCPSFRLPKSRRAFWKAKIHGNQARDLSNESALTSAGWHVVTIWECALKKKIRPPMARRATPGIAR
jgi:DNA mismatch endonuclease (patch repair protein)